MEHVKNVLAPSDARTIEARLNDFAVPEGCARFVTCQNLGKLLGSFETITADTDERVLRAIAGTDDDAKAILKRCIFVEVRGHLIKPDLRRTHRDERCSKGTTLRAMANKMRQEGDGGHSLTTQVGLWTARK